MGQQQLLLVILVTIIVGIATVVAINIFGTAAEQANRDAVRQDLLGAATQAQGLFARPAMMDGIARDFDNLDDIRKLMIPGDGRTTDARVFNENGEYSYTGSGNTLTITGEPQTATSADDHIELRITFDPSDNSWSFTWDGEEVEEGDGTGS